MGWASGSRLFADVIPVIEKNVPANQRKQVYRELIDAFRDHDWDTLDECLGISFYYDQAYDEIYPNED